MNEDTTQPETESNDTTNQQLEISGDAIATNETISNTDNNTNNDPNTIKSVTDSSHDQSDQPGSSAGGGSNSSGSANSGMTSKELAYSKFSKMYDEAWQRGLERNPQDFIEEHNLPQPRGGDFNFRAVYGSDDDDKDDNGDDNDRVNT